MRKRFIVVPLIILAVIGLMTVGVDLMQKYTEQRLRGSGTTDENHGHMISEKTLNVGKYYEDGDTDKSYFEIYGDGTMQWKNKNVYQYLVAQQKASHPEVEINEQELKEQAEYSSSKHEYTIVDFYSIDMVMIAWEWSEETESVRGCQYIDKNTFTYDEFTFKYVK